MFFDLKRPTVGVLAGWQFYRTATNLSYLAPIFRGMSRAAQDLNCNLLLGCGIGTSANPNDPLRPAWPFLSTKHDFVPIGSWNTDGLLIANPLHARSRSDYVQSLIAAGHPILFIGSGEPGPTIVADNMGGILEAIRHLIDHGHRQIAFVAGTAEDASGDSGDRLRAYQVACQQYGLDQSPHLIAYGRHVYDGGYAAMQQIIGSGARFSAVLASNDESALGAMKALESAGRKIPQDVAVIGFDNRLDGAVNEPALSSIHVPLFDIGYRAVDLLLQHIRGEAETVGTVKVETRLVVRESCGCGAKTLLTAASERLSVRQLSNAGEREVRLVKVIAPMILNQTYRFTEAECLSFCRRLVDTFTAGIREEDSSEFLQALGDVLRSTAASDENLHIWQDAISILARELGEEFADHAASSLMLGNFVNEARLVISAQMQRQHQQYVMNERWISSRLSLLTSELLLALDELQIYEVLAKHLPDMGIRFAMLGLFEGTDADPFAQSTLRDIVHPDQPLAHFDTRKFPPLAFVGRGIPSTLTLIPMVDPSGQTGFMVFGTERFDLYGAVVQQVVGALNTVRLYHQATEGRLLAEEANRMKSRFLSTISHELRTPLNLILGVSGLLLEEGDDDQSRLPDLVQRDLERIHAYAQHLGGLIGDVLDLATSDAGQLRLNMELMDLGDALRMVIESGRQLTADKGLGWVVTIPETGFWVWGDRTRLRQVVLNLINNAIKFTTRGEISLRVEAGDGTVKVQVHDTGLGIPTEEQALIFDEFRRSERSISLGYPGLGLGLAICKMLIEMHGGTIGVESTGIEGEGSTFYFELPTVQPPDETVQPAIKTLASEPTVLVLTNRSGSSSRLCDQLNQRGIKVQTALIERPPDWRSILAKSPPDAILLDVSLESELAWRILKSIQGSPFARMIPVMFYTSSPDGESLLNLDYLTKPIELTELT
ncbi:MAG: substrate-binding domain-containing protein, partial [Anaerolineales bacterium]|nr:substrate-binding domain-containing protein [Anaerolineales bacterium]